MISIMVVVSEVFRKSIIQRVTIAVTFRVNIFIFNRPPKSFNKYIVQRTPPTIHTYFDFPFKEFSCEISAQACPKQGFKKESLRLEYGCYKQF